MKKIVNLIVIVVIALALAACNKKPVTTDEVKVYFYEYRNAYKKDENNPDIFKQAVYRKGELLEEPEKPIRNGYMFTGWYKDITKKEKWDFENDVLERNTTLFADWETAVYKINLELNDGEFTSSSGFNGEEDENGNFYYLYESGVAQALHKPVKTGYKFLGWFKSEIYKKGDKQETSVDRTISEEMTYYAHWELLRITITFRVNLENKTEPEKVATTVYDYGQTIDFPKLSDVTDEYTFIGWNTRSDGSGDMLINGEPLEREFSTTLYAQWELK